MKKVWFFIYYWLPPLAVMITIFLLSSRQRISVSESEVENFIVFKSLHLIEYAVLYFLIFRAYFRTFTKMKIESIYYVSIATAILYAISDEYHQMFTPTRGPSLRDVLIDTIGILIAFVYTKKYLSKLKRFL